MKIQELDHRKTTSVASENHPLTKPNKQFPEKRKEREKGKERVPFLRDGCCSEGKGLTAGTERSGKAEREKERERGRERGFEWGFGFVESERLISHSYIYIHVYREKDREGEPHGYHLSSNLKRFWRRKN